MGFVLLEKATSSFSFPLEEENRSHKRQRIRQMLLRRYKIKRKFKKEEIAQYGKISIPYTVASFALLLLKSWWFQCLVDHTVNIFPGPSSHISNNHMYLDPIIIHYTLPSKSSFQVCNFTTNSFSSHTIALTL